MRPSLARPVLAATLILAAASCGGSTLPDEFLGRWFYTGTSGGIAGDSTGERDGRSIVITSNNTIEHYGPDGTLVTTERFRLSRGSTIFGEDGWILSGPGMIERVITVYDGGMLTLAENVYDGFASSYERDEP